MPTLKDVAEYLRSEKPMEAYRTLLPADIGVDRFLAIALSYIGSTQGSKNDITKCTCSSTYKAVRAVAECGLYIDGKEATLIARYNKATEQTECHYQVMVDGMKKLIFRTGEVSHLNVRPVFMGDTFEVVMGTQEEIRHVPDITADRSAKSLVAVYSMVRMRDGSVEFEVMTKQEIEANRKRSRTPDKGPWVTDYVEMAKKTVIRRHWKTLTKESGTFPPIDDEDDLETEVGREVAPSGASKEPAKKAPAGRSRAIEALAEDEEPNPEKSTEAPPGDQEAADEPDREAPPADPIGEDDDLLI